MKFEIEYIEKLAKIITDQELSEISLEDGEQAITIRKDTIVVPPAQQSYITPAVQSAQPVVTENKTSETSTPSEVVGTEITSPMVGTFYMAPSPDSAPFVTVGTNVNAGDVVCIIEAMKMMNEIKAEVSGKITKICVEDGQPVEFGQVLMYVE